MNILVIFQLKLKFVAFYFNFALALMFENGFIGLPMFGWRHVPSILSVLSCSVRPQRGHVANDIAVSTAVSRLEGSTLEKH